MSSIQSMDTTGAEMELIGRKATTVAGDPVESYKALYSRDGVEAGIWKCTPGSFTTFWDGRNETVQILAGEGTLTEENGTSHELKPGAFVVMPAGARATWEIRETLVKSYTITLVAPKA